MEAARLWTHHCEDPPCTQHHTSREPEAANIAECAIVTSAAVERKMETIGAHRLPPTSFLSQFPGASFWFQETLPIWLRWEDLLVVRKGHCYWDMKSMPLGIKGPTTPGNFRQGAQGGWVARGPTAVWRPGLLLPLMPTRYRLPKVCSDSFSRHSGGLVPAPTPLSGGHSQQWTVSWWNKRMMALDPRERAAQEGGRGSFALGGPWGSTEGPMLAQPVIQGDWCHLWCHSTCCWYVLWYRDLTELLQEPMEDDYENKRESFLERQWDWMLWECWMTGKALKRTLDKFGMGRTTEKWSGKAAKERIPHSGCSWVLQFPLHLEKQTAHQGWRFGWFCARKVGLSSHPAGFSSTSKYCWMEPNPRFYVFKAHSMFGVYISFVTFPRLWWVNHSQHQQTQMLPAGRPTVRKACGEWESAFLRSSHEAEQTVTSAAQAAWSLSVLPFSQRPCGWGTTPGIQALSPAVNHSRGPLDGLWQRDYSPDNCPYPPRGAAGEPGLAKERVGV